MRFLPLVFVVGGCTSSVEAWDLPAKLAPTGGTDAWRAQVAEAAGAWDLALSGCTIVPFAMSDDATGKPVVLVAASDWTYQGEGGWQDADQIQVLDRPGFPDSEPAVLHELGHALGLGHVDPALDAFSVMKPAIGTLRVPSSGDAARARALLGCP